MSESATISEAVARIEENAERKEATESIEDSVDDASSALNRINRSLDDLAKAVEELQFYRQILDEAFSGEEPESVHSAIQAAENAVDADREDMVEMLRGGSPEQVRSEITAATDQVKDASQKVQTKLNEDYWREWKERVSSARELQRIIGSQNDEFARTIDWIERLVTKDMQNPQKRAKSVTSEWENATDQWSDHQDLQGLSAFQETHELSDNTIQSIQMMSQDSVALSDVDIEVLRELKGIPDLEESIDLEI